MIDNNALYSFQHLLRNRLSRAIRWSKMKKLAGPQANKGIVSFSIPLSVKTRARQSIQIVM